VTQYKNNQLKYEKNQLIYVTKKSINLIQE